MLTGIKKRMNPSPYYVTLARAVFGGFPLGVLIAGQFSESWLIWSFVGIIFVIITYHTQNAVASIIVLFASIAIVALCFDLLRSQVSISLPIEVVTLSFLTVGALLTRYWTVKTQNYLTTSSVVLNLSLVAFLAWASSHISWDGTEALKLISVTQEDNGTWLDGVARTIRNESDLKDSETLMNGLTGSIATALLVGGARVSGSLMGTHLDTAVMTLRLYWLLTIALAVFSAHITFQLSLKVIRKWAVLPALCAAFGSVIFALGIHEVGHFTALLAGVMLSSVLCLLIHKPFRAFGMIFVTTVLLWSVGNSWYTLHALNLLIAVVCLISFATHNLNASSKLVEQLRLHYLSKKVDSLGHIVSMLIAVTIIAVAVLVIGTPIVRYLSDSDNILRQLSLGGGHANVHPYTAIGLFVLSIFVVTRVSIEGVGKVFVAIVLSSITFVSVLVAIGSFIFPYEPQYGAMKSLHLICMALTPIAMSGLVLALSRLLKSPFYGSVTTVIFVVMGTLTYMAPYPKLMDLVKQPQSEWWVEGAAAELQSNPQRLLLCLDSRGNNFKGYTAYVCSRLLAGIQGATTNATYTWTAANICLVNAQQIADLDTTWFANVTLIVTDRERLVSSVDCDGYGWAGPNQPRSAEWPIGWLSGVPWQQVRVVDVAGNEVSKSFEYLRTESGFTDAVVDLLQSSLESSP